MSDHLDTCSTEHGYDECDCPASYGPSSLTCDHCDGPAMTSSNGLFTEQTTWQCETCGIPGAVLIDDDAENPLARWYPEDFIGVFCQRKGCKTCAGKGDQS